MEDYIFLSISKTGSNSMANSLSRNGIKCYEHNYLKNIDYSGKKIIAGVRNPYTRIHSLYEYFTKVRDIIDENNLKDFVMSFGDYIDYGPAFDTCYNILNINGVLDIDTIIKFESIENDYKSFCDNLGIKNRLSTDNVNKLKSDYSVSLFDSEMIEHVNTIFHDDFVNFGYTKL
jgi:hypothetical protein